MSAKTEKKLENLENDVKVIEEKQKEIAEKLRTKKAKTEETRNLVIVEIVRENNVSINDLKEIIKSGGKSPEPVKTAPVQFSEKFTQRKEIDNEEII